MTKFVRFIKDESGATAIEYGLIAAAMGLMLIVAAPLLATQISVLFAALGAGMQAAAP